MMSATWPRPIKETISDRKHFVEVKEPLRFPRLGPRGLSTPKRWKETKRWLTDGQSFIILTIGWQLRVRTIERFAEATLVPRATIGRVARALREADSSLFPHDPVGRNKSTELAPPHFVNLLIGMVAGDPITSAPRLVGAYRRAAYKQPLEEVLGEIPVRAPILPGQSLGLDLESLIDFLARPHAQNKNIRGAFDGDFQVTLVVGEALVATVERPSMGRVDSYDAKPWLSDKQTPRPIIVIQGRSQPVVPLRRIGRLNFSHFEVAAELWADSLSRGADLHPFASGPVRQQSRRKRRPWQGGAYS